MRVVLLGAGGQLASDLAGALSGWDLVPLAHSDLDICDAARVRKAISGARPDVVINTAAFNRVDDCEAEVSRAFSVNAYGARNVALVCRDLRCAMAHISTDYVFGDRRRTPRAEDDAPCPLNAYGVSKLAGEHFVRALCPAHFIVRTCGLYGATGSRGKGGNFVETMIRMAREGRPIRVVDDQVCTPTYTRDLAWKLRELVQTDAYGLYHITNRGQCSWYRFARRIFDFTGLRPDLRPTTTASFGAPARRPSYSVLASTRLKRTGLDALRPWPLALRAYLREKGHISC